MDCIVSEVHIGLCVHEGVLGGRGTNVSSLEPVSFKPPVYYCPQHIVTDVEFPTVVKKRLLYVLLHNKCLGSTIIMHSTSLQNAFDLLE